MTYNHIKYTEGWKYRLEEKYEIDIPIHPECLISEEFFSLSIGGHLVIERLYCWDGPSGPTIDTKNFMRGSLVHDVCYQMMREGFLDRKWKDRADLLLQEMFLEDSAVVIQRQAKKLPEMLRSSWVAIRTVAAKARSWWIHRGVEDFGAASTEAKNEPKVLTAP